MERKTGKYGAVGFLSLRVRCLGCKPEAQGVTLFPGLRMASPRRKNLEVVVGACELRAGTAFRFGNERLGNWRLGEVVGNEIALSFAVAASAAYPIFLPTFDRTFEFNKKGAVCASRVLLTDGGVYDNLGTQVLEPGRDSAFSLHTFPCEYIISGNGSA